ncbi:hypothetical protein [Pantoea septica]|uniref:hypothetical protein n=1 Tax=Pantoea septica TaxID=472695 RepID=UPI0028A00EBA|nr:hypothetical protein [Pantoea septica]
MDEKYISYETLIATRESAQWMFWTMLGTFVSALVTFSAVMVSLYIALKKPKLHVAGKVSSSWMISVDNDLAIIRITVVNRSQYPVKIKSVAWVFSGSRKKIEFQQLFRNGHSDRLPIKLDHGDEANFRIPLKESSADWVDRMAQKIKRENLDVNKLACYVTLSTGERFKLKVNEIVKKKISDAMLRI